MEELPSHTQGDNMMNRRDMLRLTAGTIAASYTSGLFAEVSTRSLPGVSMGYHNPGKLQPFASSSSYIKPYLDAVRVGTRRVVENGVLIPTVAEQDDLIQHMMDDYGPYRMLFVINDFDDSQRMDPDLVLQITREIMAKWKPKMIQPGNEESNFGGATPAQVQTMLADVYALAKSIDPEVTVVSPAFYGIGNGAAETHKFWDLMDRRGGIERHCDVLGTHDYTDGMMTELHAAKRSAMGWQNVPIHVTEANTLGTSERHGYWLREIAPRFWDSMHEDYSQNETLPAQTVYIYQANSKDDFGVLWHKHYDQFGFVNPEFENEFLSGKTQRWYGLRSPENIDSTPELSEKIVIRPSSSRLKPSP